MGWRRVSPGCGAWRNDRLCIYGSCPERRPSAIDRGGKAGAKSTTVYAGAESVGRPAKAAGCDHGRCAGAVQGDSPVYGAANRSSQTEGPGGNTRHSHAGPEAEVRRVLEALGRRAKEKRTTLIPLPASGP